MEVYFDKFIVQSETRACGCYSCIADNCRSGVAVERGSTVFSVSCTLCTDT